MPDPILMRQGSLGVMIATALAALSFAMLRRGSHAHSVREKLPPDLQSWRALDGEEGIDAITWGNLRELFKARGYTFWSPRRDSLMVLPTDTDIASNGFGYAPLLRGMDERSPLSNLYSFSYPHPSCQAAQAADGRSVVIRVLAIGKVGRRHIDILKIAGRGPYSLVTWNHTIPLLDLIDFEDITFGVFPKVGDTLVAAYDGWAENSLGDVLDMILQCLEVSIQLSRSFSMLRLTRREGTGFRAWHAHCAPGTSSSIQEDFELTPACQDAFKDNFLVQWQPESLKARAYPVSRPRVYLNDFETAVMFGQDVPIEDCVCTGLPHGPSFPGPEKYRRPVPPEVESGKPYNPFKLDVWQFAMSLRDFKSNIPEVDNTLELLRNPDPLLRISAYEAMATIANVVAMIPPYALAVPPIVLSDV
ncbi:hypothetical protein NUW54_g650 [Trametes sanguinea]|uniref:Uncharacterized protein n=1 Tax=Trametes sanguinea TaxID=158606 RepID=A0ACC1QB13_9APHY|nr:hypothetical protein NUW54_g650 [Trametes sanguinea]